MGPGKNTSSGGSKGQVGGIVYELCTISSLPSRISQHTLLM